MITCTFEDGVPVDLRHVCVDVIVLQDDKILLAKRAPKLREGGKWGLLGGFMGPDETLVQAAKREILEESGYLVKDATLFRIIDEPNRPNDDRQNIAFVYFCTATEKIGEPDDESTEQKWFNLDEIPLREQIAFDHYDNIQLYKKFIENRFPLPVIR